LPAGQWFDAGTRVWPVGSLSVEERVGAPRWRQCRDSNADRNGHGFRQIRGRLSRQFPQLRALLRTFVDALVDPGGQGVAGSNPVVPDGCRAVPQLEGCRPDLHLCSAL